jgi:hypothetical protein
MQSSGERSISLVYNVYFWTLFLHSGAGTSACLSWRLVVIQRALSHITLALVYIA